MLAHRRQQSFSIIEPVRTTSPVAAKKPKLGKPVATKFPVKSDGPKVVGMALLGPSRGGYRLQSVERVALQGLSNGWTYRSRVSLGIGADLQKNKLVIRDFETRLDDRRGHVEYCNPSGCSTAIAQVDSSVSSEDVCDDLVNTLETGISLTCIGALTVLGTDVGLFVGLVGGLILAPESGGTSLVWATLGGGAGGALALAGLGASICPIGADFVLPQNSMKSACVSMMSKPPSATPPTRVETTTTAEGRVERRGDDE